jgi:hypothetical protein
VTATTRASELLAQLNQITANSTVHISFLVKKSTNSRMKFNTVNISTVTRNLMTRSFLFILLLRSLISVETQDEDVDEMLASCLTWKSSAPDHKKTAADIYETTGIFASACRHGFIIKVCEMVRSGEL